MPKVLEADVIVVGCGIAGAMAAYVQAQKGRRVTLVDRGVLLSHELTESIFDQESVLNVTSIPRVPVRFADKPERIKYLPLAVGGLARFYAGVSLRMREREFENWPVSYAEMEPYYSRAEQLMGISGIPGRDPSEPPRSRPFPGGLPPMTELSRKLFEGAEKIGLKPFQHPFAIRFAGCKLCNYCNQVPCPVDVKWSPDRFLAEGDAPAVDLHAGIQATKIHWSAKNGEKRVEFISAWNTQNAEEIELRANKYIIAAGALFTPELLIRSGLKDDLPLLGSHLMTHCLGLVLGIFPSRISAEEGFHKWFSVSDFYYTESGEVRGLIQQDHLTTRRSVFGRIPRPFHRLAEMFYYRTCQLLVIAQDEPRLENRIEVGDRPIGSQVFVRQTFGEGVRGKREYLVAKAKKIMKSAGAVGSLAFNGQSVYHACGTARMGDSPDRSVVDKNGLVIGTRNLFVCDASVFPTSGGVNPSLTIAANALRISDHI